MTGTPVGVAELSGVGLTAVWVAMMRAGESSRPDRLFEDRLASAFVTAIPAAADGGTRGVPAVPPGASEFLAIRTRFYDDYLLRTCAGGVRQVVLLAAGLDTRAFRLGWPAGVRLFELDLPGLFGFKETVLARQAATATCQRVAVPVDLRTDWAPALTAAGFDPTTATAWLAEGLLLYLTMTDNDRLLSTIGRLSTPESHLAFDHMNSTATTRTVVRQAQDATQEMNAPWKSFLDNPEEWLAHHGWQTTTTRIPELGTHYGRPLPDFVDLAASNATILCTATRLAA